MYSELKSETLRYLGYHGQTVSHEIEKITDAMLKKALSLKPLHIYTVSDVIFSDNAVILPQSKMTLPGKSIQNHLFGAEKCILFACTLGVGADSEILRLQTAHMTEAIVFDAACTACVEAAANRFEKQILQPFYRKGFFSNSRYSPGYGDLPIELQQSIVNTLDCPKKIGLTVTENNILIPRKSITAFIGLFRTPQKTSPSKCIQCTMYNSCKMRKDGDFCD